MHCAAYWHLWISKMACSKAELSQLQILGGEQQRRQRHTVNRHKHTFPEPHNPSVATPSPPRVKNAWARWCVGKTQRAGEHEKTQSRFCGAQQRFWFDAIMADRRWSLAFQQWASHHGNFQKTLNTKRRCDFLLWVFKERESIKRAKQPILPLSKEAVLSLYVIKVLHECSVCSSSQRGLNI